MVSFVVVVLDELVNRTTQRAFANGDDAIQARLFIVLTKRSAYALRLGDRGHKRSVSTPAAAQRVSKRVGEAWIAIMQEEAFPAQASITSIGELATALDHLLRCALP